MKWSVLELLRLFIGVLAFANEDPHEVEVAVPSRTPNDPEPELSLRVLADIECNLVLTIASIPELRVKIDGPSQEFFAHPGEAIVGSIVKRGPLALIESVDVALK